MGIVLGSALLLGISLIPLGLGLLCTYVRRNKDVSYKLVRLPERKEDDTVEFNAQSDDRDHADKR